MLGRGWVGRSLLAGAIGTLGLVHSCAEDSASLHIICNVAPTVDQDGCVYDANARVCRGLGYLNLTVNRGYTVGLSVESGLSPRQSNIPIRPETNGMQVKELEVEIQRPDGASIKFDNLPNPFTLPVSGYLAPGGRAAVVAVVMPFSYAEQLREVYAREKDPITELVLSIAVRAQTNGGGDVESAPWTFPVTLVADNLRDQAKGQCFVPAGAVCGSLYGQDEFATACQCALTDTCAD